MPVSTTKKTTATLTPPNLVENFEIVILRLCESQSRLQLDGGDIPTQINIEIKVGYNVDAERKGVRIRCDCRASTAHEADKPPAVAISAAYECIYKAKTDKAMDSVDQLIPSLSVSAQFHAWPYLRRSIHQTSLEMGVPPILLPLFGPRAMPDPIAKSDGPARKTKSKSKTK